MSGTLAIIGTGNVGAALGRRATRQGLSVRFGVREGADVEALLADCPGAAAVPVADAARGADATFLCVPAGAAEAAAGVLQGADVVVDCTNPVTWDGGPVWTPPAAGSVTAELAAAFPALRVVKAFNVFGAEWHEDPTSSAGPIDVPLAGDDAEAKGRVRALTEALGFRPIDAGGLRNAALLEAHAVLWIHLATVGGQGRAFAFKHLGRPSG